MLGNVLGWPDNNLHIIGVRGSDEEAINIYIYILILVSQLTQHIITNYKE